MSGRVKGTLKVKILISVVFCFLLVGIPAFFILFSHMNSLIYIESEEVNRARILNAVGNVNDELSAVVDAVAWICGEESVREALLFNDLSLDGAAMAVIEAQSNVSTYMTASAAWKNLNKIVIFNADTGFFFEYVKNRYGNLDDINRIISLPEFQNLSFPTGSVVRLFFTRTLDNPSEPAVAAYGKIRGTGEAYVYAEISAQIFSPLFSSSESGNVYIVSPSEAYPEEIPQSLSDESSWSRTVYDLFIPDCSVVQFIERSPLRIASSYGLAAFIGILITSIILLVLLSALLSRYLTRATYRLEKHIRYLTATNDFGYVDPDIEKGNDEIAAIGHTVNAMSVSISELLKRNESLFEEKKRMEIDMLQMQVNPHFLYNTLESIHYLAEIQKNDGIARMSRGLTTLLRNIAKGQGDKILLSEELDLLSEYDEIQQVRYMGMYEIEYLVPEELRNYMIQKFTLQPLVENAIFHGIEPSGRYGKIIIEAELDKADLVISVTDDGVGMDDSEIAHVFERKKHSKTDMTGVGVRNIDERIKLLYGSGYGLSFESEKGVYTKAVVRIKAEQCTEF